MDTARVEKPASGLRFSVVVTCFNYRDYVAEAVDSVLAQSLPAVDLVIVDDGSTDGSDELLSSRYGTDARVTIVSKANGGQFSAFMAGVARCTGEIIAFLDADDRWEPDYLQTLDQAYRSVSQPDFVFTNLQKFGRGSGTWNAPSEDRDVGITALLALYRRRWIGSPTSALSMKAELARRLMAIPDEIAADWRKSGADDALVLGASVLGARKLYLDTARACYREHGSNSAMTWRAGDAISKLRRLHANNRLLQHYAAIAGLGISSLGFCKQEFATHVRPTASDLMDYLKLASLAPMGFLDRLEARGWMIGHYLRRRFRAG